MRFSNAAPAVNCSVPKSICITDKANLAGRQLQAISMPTVTAPVPLPPPKPVVRNVGYVVESRGTLTADLAEFKRQVKETLNDARGWGRMGATFTEVAAGGSFTVVLSEASQMTTFSANGCDTTYSCNVGRYVIINQDRWLNATQPWNNSGGSLRDYRHMVVNHETGHWLGHGHAHCSAAGAAAAVMQQQSINLEGCAFNPWPLENELWSSTLGIRL